MENVGELNSNYVTFGSTPNMDGIDTSFEMPSFSEDEKHNLKNFTRLLNNMGYKSNLYFDVDPRQKIEDVSMHSTWDEIKDDETKDNFIFDKKNLSNFDAGLNTHSHVNKDVDALYSIGGTICYNPVCVKCVKEDQFYKQKYPISNYFCFPGIGIAVGLRPGDIILFNPLYPHCISTKTDDSMESSKSSTPRQLTS